MKVATCIKWETDGYDDIILPTEIEIPAHIEEDDYDAIDDYLSDVTGFLHNGYVLEDVDANFVSKETFDKLINAVDVVCMECLYADENTCAECPVRKTMDRTETK